MSAHGVIDALSAIAFLGLCGAMFWWSTRHEPHWVSKDGRRMIARAQRLGAMDVPDSGWREVRVHAHDDYLVVTARGPRGGNVRGTYRPIAKSPNPPGRREIYILQGEIRILLRVPTTSRAVITLDSMM